MQRSRRRCIRDSAAPLRPGSPRDYRVLPGHMEPSTLDRERRYNPYMQMALREQG